LSDQRSIAEHAWASSQLSGLSKVPTQEPHYTKKDDNLMQYIMERCIRFENQEVNGQMMRVPTGIDYQDILDAGVFRLSHLESVSFLTTSHVEVQYCLWKLNYHIMSVKYDAKGDHDAQHLVRQLDSTVYNILHGRAHMGTHQKYDATVAGARRSVEVTTPQRKKGILDRFAGR